MPKTKFDLLFAEGKIGSLTVKNRLIMPPMVRNYATTEGLVTDRYVAHIERVARGGVGTIILEASYIRPDGKGFGNELGIHIDEVIPGLKKLVKVAHQHGAAIGPQLYHAGRQTGIKTTGVQPVAPSAVADPSSNEMPRALTITEINELVAAYAEGARRAKEAGCDFVEVHGAHGYLITQFLSPFSNKRTDRYGGSLENRMRFALEVVAAVKQAVGEDFPILMRLSGDEMVDDGIKIKDTVLMAKALAKSGVNAFHISVGNYASYARGMMIPPMATEDGPLVSLAAKVKKAVKVPVITVAKIRTPQMAVSILKKKQADFIAIGRTLLADPEWPRKVQDGELDQINKCVACNQGCISRLFAGQDVWCTVNPETGRELEFQKPKTKSKKVIVVGGGPAGMEAAKVAVERGHQVALYEKEKQLGGQLAAAAAAPHRGDWQVFRAFLQNEMERLGVRVHLGQEFTAAIAKKEAPDTVIVAMGSSPTYPKIPGIERSNVLIARDVLLGKTHAKGVVVVAGGGCAGAQTAEFLAKRGHRVTIVEATEAIALDVPTDERALLLERLTKQKVKMLTNTKVSTIGSDLVSVEQKTGQAIIPADTVVVCLGSFSNDGLVHELKQVVPEVLVVGDAVSPRRVTESVAEGALAALSI